MLRRRALLIGAASAAGLSLAGLGYRAWDRGLWSAGEGPAYAPWGEWQGDGAEGLKQPLHAAILAANPHDTQPWLFRCEGNAISVFADRARNLGSFDPFRREMHLGLGAAIENLVLAARAFGWSVQVQPAEGRLSLSPADTPLLAASLAFTHAPPVRDALFDAIPHRHTNRGPYFADRPIGTDSLDRLTHAAESDAVAIYFAVGKTVREELGKLIVAATESIIADPKMSADSARWFRTGRREIAAHRDGVTVDTAGLSPLVTALSKILPDMDARSADQYWLALTRDSQIASAPLLGMLLVRDRLDMRTAIGAGRAWQRLHLAATAEGLAAQPLNQPVERIDRDAMLGKPGGFGPALAELAGLPGWEPTFVFRLGIPERAAGPSPRRALDEVILA